jgi:hypothetical protein
MRLLTRLFCGAQRIFLARVRSPLSIHGATGVVILSEQIPGSGILTLVIRVVLKSLIRLRLRDADGPVRSGPSESSVRPEANAKDYCIHILKNPFHTSPMNHKPIVV